MKGGAKQTVNTSQSLDPASQAYVNQQRGLAQRFAGTAADAPGSYFVGADPRSIADQAAQFMNPYQQNVIDATRGEFDFLRGRALQSADQQATAAGAYGGSRHGLMAGARLGEIDRAQASQLAQLYYGGWNQAVQQGLGYSEYQRSLAERQAQEPLFRGQQALQFYNLGMGPVGTNQKQEQIMPRNIAGSAIGGAAVGSKFGWPGAVIGGIAGGLLG